MAHLQPFKLVCRKQQSGVAAIEFALIATLMVLMLLGMFIYWRALQAQQSVARATGDGARIVQNLIYGALPDYDINQLAKIQEAAETTIKASLLNSGIPGNSTEKTTVTLTKPAETQLLLEVTYQLPALFGNSDATPQAVDLGHWALTQPAILRATSTVSFTPSE